MLCFKMMNALKLNRYLLIIIFHFLQDNPLLGKYYFIWYLFIVINISKLLAIVNIKQILIVYLWVLKPSSYYRLILLSNLMPGRKVFCMSKYVSWIKNKQINSCIILFNLETNSFYLLLWFVVHCYSIY